jgi:hypothetical protein
MDDKSYHWKDGMDDMFMKNLEELALDPANHRLSSYMGKLHLWSDHVVQTV